MKTFFLLSLLFINSLNIFSQGLSICEKDSLYKIYQVDQYYSKCNVYLKDNIKDSVYKLEFLKQDFTILDKKYLKTKNEDTSKVNLKFRETCNKYLYKNIDKNFDILKAVMNKLDSKNDKEQVFQISIMMHHLDSTLFYKFLPIIYSMLENKKIDAKTYARIYDFNMEKLGLPKKYFMENILINGKKVSYDIDENQIKEINRERKKIGLLPIK